MVIIGVLSLQGAFALHRPHIEATGAVYREVVTTKDFAQIDGLIIPGGESGVMLKLIDTLGIEDTLHEFLQTKPSWGICAGAILLAKTVTNPTQKSFGLVDVTIERNSYGRQLQSSEETVASYKVSYIRAPRITKVGSRVQVLAQRDEDPTWVESGPRFLTTFHPETNLNYPSPWHKKLLSLCKI